MLVKDTSWLDRHKKKRTVASSGTVDRSTGGTEYAIIDARQGGELHTVHEIDGEQVRLVNRTGLTKDRDIAMAAKEKGLIVVPREIGVSSGKVFMAMSDLANYDLINWSHKDDEQTATGSDQGL